VVGLALGQALAALFAFAALVAHPSRDSR